MLYAFINLSKLATESCCFSAAYFVIIRRMIMCWHACEQATHNWSMTLWIHSE